MLDSTTSSRLSSSDGVSMSPISALRIMPVHLLAPAAAVAPQAQSSQGWVDCDAFVLIAASNPCPCGYHVDPRRACSCAAVAIGRYQKRISGPLLDRIDIHLDVPRIPHEQLSDRRPGEPSAAIQERVDRARQIQARRFAGTALLTNADMGPKELRQHAVLDDATEALLGAAVRQMGLSARAYHRVLKLARTIADLAAEEQIVTAHVAEALQYRPRVAEA